VLFLSAAGNAVRCELGSVMYAANVLGSRGPRKMQVALPGTHCRAVKNYVFKANHKLSSLLFLPCCVCAGLDEQGRIKQWKDTGGAGEGDGSSGADDILTRMKDRNLRDLVYLINKPPRWNEQVGAYVLNFNGRVTMASVKNFQLVDPDEQNAVVLQVGP
jgi:tubby-related protein 1